MDILFSSDRLQKQCTVNKTMVRKWGQERAKRLRMRLDQLKAAPHLGEMRNLPGRCHELTGGRQGEISIDLDGPYRLIFEVANDPLPQKADGGLDWNGVTQIRILGIEDTHA